MPPEVLAAYYHQVLDTIQSGYDRYSFLLGYLLWAVLIGIIATLVLRLILLIRELRQPNTMLVLTPPRETEVSLETTTQFIRLLHGIARYRSWLDRLLLKLSTYSLEIVSQKETGVRYILRVPKSQADTIAKTLRGYLAGLKITEGEDYLADQQARIVEFGLREHFAKPLRDSVDLSTHDPIAYLTNNMTQLAAGETVALQVVIRPLSRFYDSSAYGQVGKLKSLIYQNRFNHPSQTLESSIVGNGVFGFLKVIEFATQLVSVPLIAVADALTGDNTVTLPDPISERAKEVPASESEKSLTMQIRSKLEQPLFRSSVRAYIALPKQQQRAREQGLVSSFAGLTSDYDQALVPKITIGKGWRFRNRLLGSSNIFSPSEVASLFHFSHSASSKTEDLVRVKSGELPAPLAFKQSHHQLDTVFATNTFGGISTPIGQTLNERRRHTYILGATGSGKTTLLSTMIYQDIVNGKGIAVVDPHGQLVEQILRSIPEERIKDVVWFAPADDGYPIALNLLDLPAGDTAPTQLQKSLVASSIDSIFKKFYDAKYFGPRMENLLRNAVLTALETPNPTLLTIQDLLTKKDFRKSVTETLTNPVLKDFWTNEFEKQGSLQRNQWISPVTNKIGGILSSPLNYNILTQPKSKLNFEDVLNSGKILLCDLSKGKIGEDASSFFGSLIIAKLQLAALRRALIPEAERRDFFLYVDEFQNFATSAFSELVSEARKYRLATILAHQSISQIENRDIIKTLLANVGTTIAFRTANPEDESFILPILSPQVSKHEITNLPLYHCYMKIMVGEPQDAFVAKVNNFTAEGSDDTEQAAIANSRATYATPIKVHSEAIVPTYQPANLHTKYVAPSGSTMEQLFPLSLTGTEYGRDWQTNKSLIATAHPTLTQIHYDIITLIYRFRFLNRLQLQSLLHLNTASNLNTWLLILTKQNYLTRNTTIQRSGKQPAIYALDTNGIRILKAVSQIDATLIRKFYREHDRSVGFIERCLLLADINLDLRNRDSKKTQYGMYLPSDYPALELAAPLTTIAPQAVIVRKRNNETDLSFIEVLSELPDKHLKTQLRRLIASADTNDWKSTTGIPFPALLLVATTPDVCNTAQRLIKQLARELEAALPKILITTSDQVTKHGITDDIWTNLS